MSKRKRKLLKETDCLSKPGKKNTKAVSDYEQLISSIKNGEQLNDGHINAANRLLQGQFTEIQGLASPVLGQKLCFPTFNDILGYSGQPYLQVLHNGNDHWIAIEIVSQEEVHVYDSLFSKPNYCIIKQISSIIKSRSSKLQLFLERVQFQQNSIDCGVYAIAFMTDLCYKLDPANRCYSDSKDLRDHLIQCFQQGVMRPFSSADSSKVKPSVMNVNLYCSCRMPYVIEHVKLQFLQKNERGEAQMIQCFYCDNWYHRCCAGISEERFRELSNSKEIWACKFKGCDSILDELLGTDHD